MMRKWPLARGAIEAGAAAAAGIPSPPQHMRALRSLLPGFFNPPVSSPCNCGHEVPRNSLALRPALQQPAAGGRGLPLRASPRRRWRSKIVRWRQEAPAAASSRGQAARRRAQAAPAHEGLASPLRHCWPGGSGTLHSWRAVLAGASGPACQRHRMGSDHRWVSGGGPGQPSHSGRRPARQPQHRAAAWCPAALCIPRCRHIRPVRQ